MDRDRAYTTVVVSKRHAEGYVLAGLELGAQVDVFEPKSQAERTRAVDLHLGTLLCEHQPSDDERTDFERTVRDDVGAAFDDHANPAVLVEIYTLAGDAGVMQAGNYPD